jgi:hypothetical protein
VDVPSGGGTRPPANPLLAMRPGGRPALESEGWGLVREIHALEPNRDPEDIVAEASAFKGADRTKLNLNTMSDDRLLNTVRDLRHMLDRLRKQAAAPQAQMSQYERLKAKRAAEGDER